MPSVLLSADETKVAIGAQGRIMAMEIALDMNWCSSSSNLGPVSCKTEVIIGTCRAAFFNRKICPSNTLKNNSSSYFNNYFIQKSRTRNQLAQPTKGLSRDNDGQDPIPLTEKKPCVYWKRQKRPLWEEVMPKAVLPCFHRGKILAEEAVKIHALMWGSKKKEAPVIRQYELYCRKLF